MLEKVRERGIKDPLLFHKLGLVAGGFAGFLVGLFISDRAEETEEIADGSQEETSPGQVAE